ncbi:phosphoribosyltransferase-like protein [Lentinula raphanica]|nr:phosphoribosyltransferase-like protein [Lentinula raphanica]
MSSPPTTFEKILVFKSSVQVSFCVFILDLSVYHSRDKFLVCGILGLLLHDSTINCAPEICEGLSLLQHRGQDACGIVTCGPKGRFYQCKANGMVRDIFDESSIRKLIGGMGVGHVRYPTAGSFNNAEAQPFYVNSPYGIVFAHNGNLINTSSLLQFMDATAHRHINTSSDSELLLNIFANNLQQTGKFRINEEDIFTAIGGMMNQVKGAYACVAMLAGFGIIAFRDPNGIRPVGMATRKTETGNDYLFASESVVADASGFTDWDDVKPGSHHLRSNILLLGEAIIITRSSVSRRQVVEPATFAPDIFEYVYFARPDSVLDGISVYRSRMAMGDMLAEEVKRVLDRNALSVDVVIPVPDTSRVAALNLAQKLNLPYREGFIKNRYVGRTFIMPGQQMRKKNVRRKLNAMALEFSGKNVLLVDDSIVRGTTSREIVQMAKDVGAKNVIVASCAPPIRYPNIYGIDMPSRSELVAYGRKEGAVAEAIGADLVIFQTLPDLIESVRQLNPNIKRFDCSVFDGDYVTGGVDEAYFSELERLRADNVRSKVAMMTGELGPAEGKGGGGVPVNGNGMDEGVVSSGTMNGDDTVGLHNSWKR